MILIDFIKKMKPHLPVPVVRLLGFVYYRLYMKFLCFYLDVKEKDFCASKGLPSASLRYRVNGTPHLGNFLHEGERCRDDLVSALARIGRRLDSFEEILDFGCGCGRTLRWLGDYAGTARLSGTDIDAQAVTFCKKKFSSMCFTVNLPLPPLQYPDAHFDLIYSISVFTHLDEEYQFNWLTELKRIVKPGGIVLLSVHGQHCWSSLPAPHQSAIRAHGLLFIAENVWKGIYPEWYQTAFHTEAYVRECFSRYFRVLDYLPRGVSNYQDLVLLQRQ